MSLFVHMYMCNMNSMHIVEHNLLMGENIDGFGVKLAICQNFPFNSFQYTGGLRCCPSILCRQIYG